MESEPNKVDKPPSVWYLFFKNRSILGLIIGQFFTSKNNTAAVIAIALVTTLCWLALNGNEDIVPVLSNVIFVIIGYYFGAKSSEASERDSN